MLTNAAKQNDATYLSLCMHKLFYCPLYFIDLWLSLSLDEHVDNMRDVSCAMKLTTSDIDGNEIQTLKYVRNACYSMKNSSNHSIHVRNETIAVCRPWANFSTVKTCICSILFSLSKSPLWEFINWSAYGTQESMQFLAPKIYLFGLILISEKASLRNDANVWIWKPKIENV